MNQYIGHESQYYGVEEHRLVGGKGDGMRLLQVRNGRGLEFTVSADRAADISRLTFCGMSMGYFSPCGYVAPAYYDDREDLFLRSFTAGFLTTCGMNNAGSPCEDAGERLPLHGSIGNTPAEHIYWEQDDAEIQIRAKVVDARLFSHKLTFNRTIRCSLAENVFSVEDRIKNEGDSAYPVEVLYHMNMGYPLLSENSLIYIPSDQVTPRDRRAAEGMEEWNRMGKPQAGFEEQCYYHKFSGEGKAGVFEPEEELGLVITFDSRNLNYFTEWKMMGVRDYVLGLEPGNCHPDGRKKMREDGTLKILAPEEEVTYGFAVHMIKGMDAWRKQTCNKADNEKNPPNPLHF